MISKTAADYLKSNDLLVPELFNTKMQLLSNCIWYIGEEIKPSEYYGPHRVLFTNKGKTCKVNYFKGINGSSFNDHTFTKSTTSFAKVVRVLSDDLNIEKLVTSGEYLMYEEAIKKFMKTLLSHNSADDPYGRLIRNYPVLKNYVENYFCYHSD